MRSTLNLLACWVVALWLSIAIVAPRSVPHRTPRAPHTTLDIYLKAILDTVDKYSKKLSEDKRLNKDVIFVESADNYTKGPDRCGDKFFCAVDVILDKYRNATHHSEHEILLENLQSFFTHKHINCTKVLKTPLNITIWVPMPTFLVDIEKCGRCHNLNLTSPYC